jgi:hypothetical protein
VAALAGGVVVWGPWTQPPVLRLAGLATGPATANSISFHWAPGHGPAVSYKATLSGTPS